MGDIFYCKGYCNELPVCMNSCSVVESFIFLLSTDFMSELSVLILYFLLLLFLSHDLSLFAKSGDLWHLFLTPHFLSHILKRLLPKK